jgi:hypothetical protein
MKNLTYLGGFLLAFFCTACVASARLETAVVTEVDGLPCFSVPNTSETRIGIPLYTLEVSRRPAPDEKVAERVWYFSAESAAGSMQAFPGKCFRHGVTPKAAEQDELKPLLPYHIYVVDIQAKQEGSNLKGYQAEFCMRPNATGRMRVQEISWNDKNRSWNYEVCARP